MVGTQNLCRLHYLAFYAVFISLAFDFGVSRSDTFDHLFVGAGNAVENQHSGVLCPMTQVLAALFFCLGNAFAAAAQSAPKSQSKMIQYAAFPLYLAIFYANRNVYTEFTADDFPGVVEFAKSHVVLVASTLGFALSTHTLYV